MEKILKEGELAIILPVLNCIEYSKQMIPTIRTKHPYKLLLINNASSDGTKKYFDELATDKDVFAFHCDDNIGVGPAWNFGIKYAIENFNSRYFFIPNNDILLHPDAIDILVDSLSAPDIALISSTNVSARVALPDDVLVHKLPKETNFVEAPDFSCFMLSKKTIDEIGYFDENFYPAYFEDNDYHYRINLKGLRGVKINRSLYFHYGSRTLKGGPDIKKLCNAGYVANREYYIRKWGGEPGNESFLTPFNK